MGRQPDNAGPLATFLWGTLVNEGLTRQALAESVGVSPGTISGLLVGHAPKDRTYERLRTRFGDDLPVVVTASEAARAQARANLPLLLARSQSASSRRKRGATQRGVKSHARSAGIKKAIASRRAQGQDWHPPASITHTLQGRAAVSLGRRLGLCPEPDRTMVNRWAVEVGRGLGLPSGAVMEIWRPRLRDRGLLTHGRPPKDDRHAIVAPLVAAERATYGRLRRGFWERTARIVEKAEARPLSHVDLKRWWYRYEKSCTACLTANVTPQQAVNHPLR